MPELGVSSVVWNNFEKTGCFKLADTSLTLNQLSNIQRYIEKYPQPIAKNISHYQFHLSNVKLISVPVLEQRLTGPPTAKEHTFGYSHKFSDVRLLQMGGTARYEGIALQATEHENSLTRQQDAFEETLLNLLNQKNVWSAIKLDKVVF